MRITVVGKGNVGSGLARRWEMAGHTVTAVGREGGDAAGAEAILVAVPSGAISDALTKVRGLGGQVTIDATNTFGAYPAGYDSLAQQVKSIVGGPTAKAFNRTSRRCTTKSTRSRSVPARYSPRIRRPARSPSG